MTSFLPDPGNSALHPEEIMPTSHNPDSLISPPAFQNPSACSLQLWQ